MRTNVVIDDKLMADALHHGRLELLHSDRDFDPFERHLGLRCVWCEI
jgi:hypothetical protein